MDAPRAWPGGWPACPSTGCRPASAAAPRWPWWPPAAPSCGCSTSPTPGSTPPGRDLLDALLGEAVAAGATVVFASHELDRAEPLAHRVVTMAGGRSSRSVDRTAPDGGRTVPASVPC